MGLTAAANSSGCFFAGFLWGHSKKAAFKVVIVIQKKSLPMIGPNGPDFEKTHGNKKSSQPCSPKTQQSHFPILNQLNPSEARLPRSMASLTNVCVLIADHRYGNCSQIPLTICQFHGIKEWILPLGRVLGKLTILWVECGWEFLKGKKCQMIGRRFWEGGKYGSETCSKSFDNNRGV